jgi:hypothetical protein
MSKNFTVTIGVAELDEDGEIKEQMWLCCMDRMTDQSSANSYAESAADYVEGGMDFNDEAWRPGAETGEEEE